jgi:hypothetical protein
MRPPPLCALMVNRWLPYHAPPQGAVRYRRTQGSTVRSIDRPSGLSLDYECPVSDRNSANQVSKTDTDEVASAQLAVDRQVEFEIRVGYRSLSQAQPLLRRRYGS